VFTFDVFNKAKLDAAVYFEDRNNERIFSQDLGTIGAGIRRDVYWTPGKSPEGWYRLFLSGYALAGKGQIVEQIVRFYHRPVVE
jgi:hypothetical protein